MSTRHVLMGSTALAASAKFRRLALAAATLGLLLTVQGAAAKGKKRPKKDAGALKPDAARVMIFDPAEPKEGPRIAFDALELARRFGTVMLFTDVQVSSDSKSSDGETVEVKEQEVSTDVPPVVDEGDSETKKNVKKKKKAKKAASTTD